MDNIKIVIKERDDSMNKSKFSDYKLSDQLLKAIELLKYENPTTVQEQVIPVILEQMDIIVKSQTGSGKTAAFAIPICEMIDWDENKPQALVIEPTRELAIQVKEEVFNLGRFKRLKVPAIYGKTPIQPQEQELKQKSHVVVGTPGRLIDHLERGNFDTSKVKYLVIDEADEMLNMGFIEDIGTIIDYLPKERVTILLSATMPKDIKSLCNQYMINPIHIVIEEDQPAFERIYQEQYDVEEKEKLNLLRDISIIENPDSCIIFCNTKNKVDEIHLMLLSLKYSCQKIHGGMEQRDRLRVMDNFKHGYFRYLIATDVASRGIDIDNISLIINFDIPREQESYVHRIGRTGRKDREGRAISFVSHREIKWMKDIEVYLGKTIDLKTWPDQQMVEQFKQEFDKKINTSPERKETKGASLNAGIMKLHINAGKKTKMRPADIVGTLCNIEGMTPEDIGIINVQDISTFVEILNNKGELVYQELQNRNIKGRLRKVSKEVY